MPRGFCFHDLEFEKIPFTAYSSCGTPYTRYRSVGVPRIPDKLLDNAFYLYKSKKQAEKGSEFGGTGFLVGVPNDRYPDSEEAISIYGVTNKHVAVGNKSHSPCPVMRFNKPDGTINCLSFDPSEWTSHLNGSDIAVISLPHLVDCKAQVVMTELFSTKEIVKKHNIGVGEDVFMIGRFPDHDGGLTNKPAARFGCISVTPSVMRGKEAKGENYCIDMHSRTGFSGSPVFVYRTPGSDLNRMYGKAGGDGGKLYFGSHFVFFLGIHWGQFQEELKGQDDNRYSGPSGMTVVTPAWEILDVLNFEKFKKERNVSAAQFAKKMGGRNLPMEESASPSNNQHKEDFNSLLDAAVKVKQ